MTVNVIRNYVNKFSMTLASVDALVNSRRLSSLGEVYIQSYYDGWQATTDGPKGGHLVHTTGGTASSPTVPPAVSVGTIGTGEQKGYYWDLDGIEWFISFDQSLNVFMFGAVGDGITDDTTAIQDAFIFAAIPRFDSGDNQKDMVLTFLPGRYKTSALIYLPFATGDYDRTNNVLISGYGARMVGSGSADANHGCFESAYLSSGTPVSTVDTSPETRLTYFFKLRGFSFQNYVACIRAQNWNHGCAIEDLMAVNCQQALYMKRCFYTAVQNFLSRGAPTNDTLPNFDIKEFANIQSVRQLKSQNHAIGIALAGGHGIVLKDCAIEEADYGLVLGSESQMCTLDNPYIEGCSLAAIRVTGVIRNFTIRDGYVNLDTSELFSSGLSSSFYAVFYLSNVRFDTGVLTIPDNFFVVVDGAPVVDDGRPQFGVTSGTGKVIDRRPVVKYDSSAVGYNGAFRHASIGNVNVHHEGRYVGGYGNTLVSAAERVPYGTYVNDNGAGELEIDTNINFYENMRVSCLLRYNHSVGSFNQHLTVEGLAGGGAVIYYRAGSVTTYINTATEIVPSDNSGKLRLTVLQHTGHSLILCVCRIL